jgi:hypothetical protein
MRSLFAETGQKSRHTLFHFFTAAMWAYDLAFLILGGCQGLRERSLTSVAEEGVVGHADLPLLELSARILGSLPVPFNLPGI